MSELSVDSLAAIDHEIAKYPKGKQASAVMSALRIAQKEELVGKRDNRICRQLSQYSGHSRL